MWIKMLLAVSPAALFLAAPAPVVHADGACTALGSDYEAYNACISKMNVHCVGGPRGFIPGVNLTCTYSDGGRDECVVHFAFLGGGRVADSSCTYIPLAAAPAPGAAPEPAPAAAAHPNRCCAASPLIVPTPAPEGVDA
ncbi:hypothetical protein [Mycolicibacter virginiensis]|uniref:hypothetical protein n=1 Tax=Mycolicibacter virginiensis TaxID=1795032 RepID=UPI0010572DD1|nr:hypothetical protein [Mycolicibacter virginiensis]